MAEYRFCYKKGKLGYAKNHAAYILREENYASRKEELVYKESGNMEMFDGTSAVKFWEYADTYERANSVVYREIEVNIPNEFNHEQAKELINNFVKKELGEKYIYTYAIHESYNNDGEKNLHCHLMFSERELDGINRELSQFFKRANSKDRNKGGAEKNRKWQDKSRLLELRKSWEIESNILLEKYGFEARVDCRSLRDIRRELLEKEMFDDAEKYNRIPVNISGKILYKVDRNISLNEKETEKYNEFLKAKKIRIEKIREKEYKDLKNNIEKLEKQDSKERALNIVTKGEYFKLKKTYFAVIKKSKTYPKNKTLLNEKINLEKQIEVLKSSVEKSVKYINICKQLELNRIRDLEKAKNLFENKFDEKYFTKTEEKIVNKYKDTSKLNLKIKEQILLSENYEEKAINVLTDYKYNRELITNFNIQNQKKLLEKQYQEATLFNPGELKNIRDKISECNKKIELSKNYLLNMIDNIDKNKLDALTTKIKDNTELELKVIREITSKDKIILTDLSYEKERLELLNKHSSLEKIYNKEHLKEESSSKKLYNLSLEIGAIENLLNNEYRITKNTEKLIHKNLHKINRDIERNNNRIKVADDTITRVNNIMKAHSKKYNLSGVEIVAIGRLSKNRYWKLYKQQKELRKEITKKEKALQEMGAISFGKSVLKKSIELHKQKLVSLNNEEKELVKRYKNTSNFKKEVEKLNKYYTKVLKDYSSISIQLKQENKVNYKLKSNVVNHEKTVTTIEKIPKRSRNKSYTRNFSPGSVRGNIDNLSIVDNAEIRSDLDINLKTEKEKEYEWER
ncbi:MobA/MobL family protein (plasmid) [Fusobacterium vincentii]|uniref:MobA/MobL family protein n=1 Tax=Fusobacterium TaxID=848 RepID=UPI001EEE6700|nr:MobA/MobL family protein [Fusobacterium nucleatum]MCG6835692.1 MobA/MobL family protein [Fusobacterium nucleatum]